MSGVRGGPRCEPRGEEGALSDPRGRLVEAQIMFTRAVWPQGAEWGFGEGCGLGQELGQGHANVYVLVGSVVTERG